MESIVLVIFLFLILIAFLIIRIFCSLKVKNTQKHIDWSYAEYKGEQQVMSDYGSIKESSAGVLAVLADGRGKEKRGRISAHIAVDSIFSLFDNYQIISNPIYFFKRCFHYANAEILKNLEDREGGAGLASVLVNEGVLYYVLAGDIKIALYRKGSLILLSEGHTINKLAENSYKQGRITKQKAVYAMKEKRLYNYVGHDGFRDIELYDVPVRLKKHDRIVMFTKGIYEALPWQELEKALSNKKMTARKQAEAVISRFINLKNIDRDNGSVIIIAVHQTGK